jgi:hypothetical protein
MEDPLKTSHRGYVDEDYPPMPTKATRFWRSNLLWQAFRFFLLNYRIMRIVVKGHS